MILRSFEHYPELRVAEWPSTALQPFNGVGVRISGQFSEDGAGRLFAIYRVGNDLALRTPEWEVGLSECVTLSNTDPSKGAWSITRQGDLPSLFFQYQPRCDRDRNGNDLTAFIDAIDFSFPHWIAKVVGNPDRRAILVSEWDAAAPESAKPQTPRG